MFAEWLQPFFTFFPVYALFFLGVGLPWALVLLPRDEWRNRPTVLALGLALGPILCTTWLFALGTWGRLVPERALTGIVLLGIIGFTGAWLRRHTGYRDASIYEEAWTGVEKTLVVMMTLAFIVHIWITMYWPFVQYDTLWTFGYNPRVFLIYERIPEWTGYYPQLVPLTYTYGQLINGEINDHVAKAAVPWFMFASVMMAYILGTRVWGKRRIGILTAAMWMLIPGALFWSGSGDLEHPITIYFTGALVFFVMAWRSHHPRYAIISGLLFGGALWTKPTAGSFALGVMLVILITGLRLILPDSLSRLLNIPAPSTDTFRQKFTIATITGLASIPVGAMWYVRNIALGHAAIDFPASYWNDMARQSGQEFGWLIVIAVLATGLAVRRGKWQIQDGFVAARQRMMFLLFGLSLFLLGTLPGAFALDKKITWHSGWEWAAGTRTPSPEHRLSLTAVLLIVIGLILMIWQLLPLWRRTTARARSSTLLISMVIAPFAVVWFRGYSYDFRLSLTITPALASMAAALIDAWVLPIMSKNRLRTRAAVFLVVWLSIPALIIAGWLTFWHSAFDPLHNDDEKYASANPALMDVVQTLHAAGEARPGRDYINVYTLGEMRLNFFFPEMQTIWRDPLPTTLDELHQITDVVVAGTHADFLWEKTATYPNQISAMMDVGFHYSYAGTYLEYQGGNVMGTVFTPILYTDDGQHRFVAYNVYTPYRNYTIEELNPPYIFEDAQWDFIALRGMEFRRVIPQDSEQMRPDENGHLTLQPGEEYYLQLYWQRTDGEKPIPQDYSVFVQMIDPESHDILSQRDGALVDNNLPMTLMPYPDLIADRRRWKLPEDLPSGTVTLYIGIYDPDAADAPRVPVTGGQFAGADGILIENVLVIQ